MSTPLRLTSVLALVMMLQAITGLLFREQYHDVEWITATWFGNDLVTLIVAVPGLIASAIMTGRGSVRGALLWLGLLAYAIYNYAFYLFGAALNVFLPLYVAALLLAAAAMILALSRIDPVRARGGIVSGALTRAAGSFLIFVGCGLSMVWLVLWALYAFAGRATPVEPEAFKVVAALDLSLMVPPLVIGGVLLWREHPWGALVATMTSVQAALYLVVLSVNSVVAIERGLVEPPGELLIWVPLALGTSIAAGALITQAGRRPHLEPRAPVLD